jgi:hypothetical protein
MGVGGGSATTKTYTQASHGFSVQQALYRKSDSTWALAKADSESTAEALGVIQSVTDNTFTLVMGGEITGLSGLTDGTTYFVSAATAGLLTATEPDSTLYYSKPLLVATSATTGMVVNMRGLKVNAELFTTANIDDTTDKRYVTDSQRTKIDNSATVAQLTTTSGDIVSQIPSLSGYATQSWANSTFIDTSEMTTVSGDLSTRITAAAVKYLTYTIDGGGAAITTGDKGWIQFNYTGTINSWTILADQSGSIVIDIWKDTYTNYPPVDADSITASALPTLSSVTKNTSSTLTGWTTAVTAGDIFKFNVDSCTTCTKVTITLKITVTV